MTAHPATGAPSAGPAAPPVTQLTMASLALVLVGGIVMVGSYPRPASLTAPWLLLAGSAALAGVSLLLLARHTGFAWAVFFRVARWALLAYVLIAAMIEFSFIHNGVQGTPLVLLSLMLVMFALDVPLSIGFTVARFAGPGTVAT